MLRNEKGQVVNEKGERLIKHHIKYKELHGVEETVWMTYGEHHKLHMRRRREGKCTIPTETIAQLSRTSESHRKDHRDCLNRRYAEKILQTIQFRDLLAPNILLVEKYDINNDTGIIYFSNYFCGHNKGKLLQIDIDLA